MMMIMMMLIKQVRWCRGRAQQCHHFSLFLLFGKVQGRLALEIRVSQIDLVQQEELYYLHGSRSSSNHQGIVSSKILCILVGASFEQV